MTFKPAGYFNFKTKDDQEIVGATASITLSNWYILNTLKKNLVSPPAFEVVEIERPYPQPYQPNFLVSIIGHIERTFGRSPIHVEEDRCNPEVELYGADWYNHLPKGLTNYRAVTQAHRNGNPQVVLYEEACLKILKWLEKQGEITSF
jgi:hypothetical protein